MEWMVLPKRKSLWFITFPGILPTVNFLILGELMTLSNSSFFVNVNENLSYEKF